ncbi:hypothetical protein BCR44DRAFT_1430713 [Catenaria anguillulae PL171]|uniref:Uncharacterized protein n=1 Tax=Catenaria anguillulae PL171 TaxID=765915 RepID=A0A1Y2HRL6_9FUNG|nr:hypothetical protein BCR44DRAFT_1430713 [Catenaria anguillulae PL171]
MTGPAHSIICPGQMCGGACCDPCKRIPAKLCCRQLLLAGQSACRIRDLAMIACLSQIALDSS